MTTKLLALMSETDHTIYYRRCAITRRYWTQDGHLQPDEWEWVHDEYTGAGDHRCGAAPTLKDCITQIDEVLP